MARWRSLLLVLLVLPTRATRMEERLDGSGEHTEEGTEEGTEGTPKVRQRQNSPKVGQRQNQMQNRPKSIGGDKGPLPKGDDPYVWNPTSTCSRINNLREEEKTQCEALTVGMQRILASVDCRTLKKTLEEEAGRVKLSIGAKAGSAALAGVFMGLDLSLVNDYLNAATNGYYVVTAPNEKKPVFQYHNGNKVQSLGLLTAQATVAIFAIGFALDLVSMGSSGFTGTAMAAQVAGAIAVPSFVAGWTHDLYSKVPDFLVFSRLVASKCHMNEFHDKMRNMKQDMPQGEEDEDNLGG